ncbi:MAG: PQQ-binding-like beta-propeller repeat protein, partial [Candidatus Bathyarchaeia archaeon]
QDPIAGPPSYPLPREYWARPIEGHNIGWSKIASNWLGSTDYVVLGSPQIVNDFQPNGIAPNSAHIMWTRSINDGGVVGGTYGGIEGNTFYTGSSYNERFSQPIIMNGRLFYELPWGNSATGGGFVCVDLRTGEQLWWTNTTGIGAPAFGYYYDYESPNQHGILPNGLLIASSSVSGLGTVWRTYDPRTGIPTTMNITNVPSATMANEVLGPSGEHIRYILTNLGTTTNPNYYLAQWNSSRVFGAGTGLSPSNWYSGTVNASLPSRYDWNISIPWMMSGATIVWTFFDDILLGRNGSLPTIGSSGPYTMWAMSLKPAKRGQLLWMKTYDSPPNNITLLQGPVDAETRVFALAYKETMQWVGYSLDDGRLLWGPTQPQTTFDYYQFAMLPYGGAPYGKAAYGKLYSSAYGGICYCYDMKNGSLLWTYGNGGPGNSTNCGLAAPWPNWPMFIFAIADGKIYLLTGEHSANTPLYLGALVRCIDAYTGKEIWTIKGYGGYRTRSGCAVADGFFVYLNHYDMQIYCFGKGPSAMSVMASPKVSLHGNKVLVEGSVIDISAGTKQHEQASRFPNGVPAVGDECMSAWMEYVYMQKPRPTDVKGVEVVVSVLDPNGNCYEVARATSDADGFFKATFEPPVPGEYTVIAEFKGSESYWPSHAKTALYVEEAPLASPPPTPPPASIADTYFIPAVVGIIAAIVVVGVVIVLLQRKR